MSKGLDRLGAAALTSQPIGCGRTWWTSLIAGINQPVGSGAPAESVVLQSTLDLDASDTVFGRVERVRKNAADLAVAGAPAAVTFVLGSLASTYGSTTPLGAAIHLLLRPPLEGSEAMGTTSGHR